MMMGGPGGGVGSAGIKNGRYNSSRALDFCSTVSRKPVHDLDDCGDHPDMAEGYMPSLPSGSSSRPKSANSRFEQDQPKIKTLDELAVDRSELDWGKPVGEGLTAQVFMGTFMGKTVAIKRFNKQTGRLNQKEEISLLRECELMGTVNHKNLVKCLGVSFEASPCIIITEFCFGGTLFELMHEREEQDGGEWDLVMPQKLKMASDIAQAMDYLHKFRPMIIHRDLKSLNLLLDTPVDSPQVVPFVKLTDFGFAKMKDTELQEWDRMTVKVGTFHWMAPEVANGNYDEKADVYSFAMVLYEILCEEVPFEELDPQDVLNESSRGRRPDLGAVPPDCHKPLVELMVKCWAHESAERPAFSAVCQRLDGVVRSLLNRSR